MSRGRIYLIGERLQLIDQVSELSLYVFQVHRRILCVCRVGSQRKERRTEALGGLQPLAQLGAGDRSGGAVCCLTPEVGKHTSEDYSCCFVDVLPRSSAKVFSKGAVLINAVLVRRR